jgi:hypothetical protein
MGIDESQKVNFVVLRRGAVDAGWTYREMAGFPVRLRKPAVIKALEGFRK